MKRLQIVIGLVLLAMVLLPISPAFSQTPKVPITYQGDNDKTIERRLQWIEEAKKERTLVWWGTRRPNEAEAIIAAFNKIYPFIKVVYWRGRGEEVAAKLDAEFASGRSSVDVSLGGEHLNYPRWRKAGMITKFTDIIPRIEKLDKRIYSRYGDYIMTGNTVILPTYNTNLVSSNEAPKSWEDLLDPKWKGYIGMSSDVKVWVMLALSEGGWGIEKTEAFLKKLREQSPIWGASHTTAHTLLIAGEFKVNAEGYLHHILGSRTKGAPVDWMKVNPAVVEGSAMSLQSKAPHPNASRLFIEWLFSPQGMSIIEKVTAKGIAFPGSETIQSKTLKGLELITPTEETVRKALELDLYKKFAKVLQISQ